MAMGKTGTWQGKDAVRLAIFSVLLFVAMLIGAIPFSVMMSTYFYGDALGAVLAGVVWMYMRSTIRKPWACLASSVIVAVIAFLFGQIWTAVLSIVVGGVLSEIIERIGAFENTAAHIVAFVVWVLCFWVGHAVLVIFSVVAFAVTIVAVALTQAKKYQATFCDTYEESGRRRIAIADRLRRLPLSFFGTRDLADVTTVMMGDIESNEHALSHALPQLWGMGLFMAASAAALLAIDWRMAVACLWVVPVSLLLVVSSRRAQGREGRRMNAAKLACAEEIQSLIDCARDIRAYNLQEVFSERFEERFESLEHLQGRYELSASVVLTSARAVLQLGIGTTLCAGAALLAAGQVGIETLLLYMLIAARIYDPVTEMLMNVLEILAVDVSNERLAEIEAHPVAEGTTEFSPKSYDVSFEDVWFSYEEGTPVLTGATFVARQGEVTALVGPSGSGKSTAAKLAARLWEPQRGTVRLGGIDVSEVDPETLLGSFSVVFQDVTLFGGTIRENIRLGRIGATDAEVEAAARAAQCDGILARLSEGIDSEISENGQTLSGGERQRISIARALLKDAPAILLDEATASLDPESETRVQRAIGELTKDKTVLVVAHRMRTVMNADRIVALEGGRAVEQGTLSELLAKDGLFARLCRLQGLGEGKEDGTEAASILIP